MKGLTGTWMPIFLLAIAFDWIGALLALFVLKPMRKRALGDAPESRYVRRRTAAVPGTDAKE